MITVFVNKLTKEKVDKIKETILNNGARLIEQGKPEELSFDCEDLETKRQLCKKITKIITE